MKSDKKHRITLGDIPRRNFQKVPEGYFDTLPGLIASRIESDNKKSTSTPVFTIGLNWKTAAIAAALTLLIVFSGLFDSVNKSISPEEMLAQINVEDIIEYLDYTDLTTYEIIAELDIDENDADDFLENDIQLLNIDEFEALDKYELYQEYGIEENIF